MINAPSFKCLMVARAVSLCKWLTIAKKRATSLRAGTVRGLCKPELLFSFLEKKNSLEEKKSRLGKAYTIHGRYFSVLPKS